MAVVQAPLMHQTSKRTPYLREAGVVLIAQTEPNLWSPELRVFLHDLDPDFDEYPDDGAPLATMSEAETLPKFAGQLCYQSFGPQRTKNAEAKAYYANILREGHGSVLEHASLSFLVYGISRACSHELVRHRHHSPSQLSQRFVGANRARFVMHPAIQGDQVLEALFEDWIDLSIAQYKLRLARLEQIVGGINRDARKWRMQCARMGMPNETETMMVLSGNLRAWRSFFIRRGALAADLEIRRLAIKIFELAQPQAPNVFQDLSVVLTDESSGWRHITSEWGHA